ncbi:hypothetical protein K2P97_07275 [bacterium]|nr:hypothetical protein [bacterium]
MKSISLFKILTLVCFLLVGSVATAQTCAQTCDAQFRIPTTGSSTDAGYLAVVKANSDCKAECTKKEADDKLKQRITRSCANNQWRKTNYPDQSTCEVCVEDPSTPICSASKEADASCKTLLEKYDEAAAKASEECERANEENHAKCLAKAKRCTSGLDAFAEPGSDGEDSVGSALVNLIGVYSQTQGATGANGQSVAGCLIDNSDSERDHEERMDEKITQLRQDISKLRNEDPAEEDQKLNEKRQEVEEKMLEARQEMEKSQNETKTKNQEEAGRLAEKIIKANADKRNRLNNIASLNDKVADKALEVQQTVLLMADALVQKQCKDSTREYRDKKLADKAKTGAKFSKAESAAFSAELVELEGTCLKAQAMEKQKKINAINNEKRAIQREIANLQAKNVDDANSMANDQKQIEALKTIASEKEKKDLENLTTKLTNLNKSVTDMETSVAARKKAFEEKAKAKEDQINKILQDRQNVKPKFAKVSVKVQAGSRAAENFVGKCCVSKYSTAVSRNYDERACERVRKDYDIKDVKPRSTKTGSSK